MIPSKKDRSMEVCLSRHTGVHNAEFCQCKERRLVRGTATDTILARVLGRLENASQLPHST
jgi:hypothetical protein